MGEPRIDPELTREAFLEMLLSLFCTLDSSRAAPDGRESLMHIVARASAKRLMTLYRDYWSIDGHFSPSELGMMLVDIEKRLGGDFQVKAVTEDKVVLETSRCPVQQGTELPSSICHLTTIIFGSLAAENTGYAKVTTGGRAAGGGPCVITVYLKKTPHSEKAKGEEFVIKPDEPLPEAIEKLDIVERLDRLSYELSASRENYQHLYEQQVVLNEISLKLASSLDIEDILEQIAKATCRLLEAPAGAVLVRDGRGHVVIRVACGAARCQSVSHPNLLPEDLTLAGVVMAQEKVAFIRDTRDKPALLLPRPVGFEIRSVASAPIREQDETVGALEVYFDKPHDFSDPQINLLESLAASASIALTNASLYREQVEATKVRDDFILSASHQLRTPLTTIRGLIDLALRRQEKGIELDKGLLLTAKEYLVKLTEMINELLDITRMERGSLEMRPEPRINIADIARGVVKQVQDISPRHKIVLEAPDVIEGEWDPERLAQVLTILVNNAVKYSPRGGEIDVAIRQEEDSVHLSVTDHGIGIPDADIKRVFEPFERGSNAPSRRFAGLGIGLPISREIVEMHGGKMWVDSAEGMGATFNIVLPLKDSSK